MIKFAFHLNTFGDNAVNSFVLKSPRYSYHIIMVLSRRLLNNLNVQNSSV